MTLVEFFILIVIAAIAGTLGQALAGYSLGGCLVSAVVGFIGAFGLPEFFPISVGNQTFPVVWSIIGSGILAAIVGMLTRRRNVIIRR